MSEDTETGRESLPSISDLSLNPQSTPSTKTTTADGKAKVEKVEILLKPTGSAPIINKNKWSLNAEKRVSYILYWLHSYFKLDAEEKIFVYVNQTFAPAPDQTIKNLYDCYGTNGKLILHYSKSPAWG
ncbi:autophagy protein 12-like [Sitodiplosis mosellana]|uniref:autophagy protein 12-like n=1 Tax=Sitodiplosis mosellana TaxID=263140 RepID=UPI002444606D|nr:autophagy protein 12-like [Sitodiplosis mosellana]XP_055321086.1 autophagy protein 12-like [Sitodiplosis mosellana]XP_055321087.1 autophagy protein 12-like [Sitodiplosis mosellana]XP_055321088.1 autophagy protein 12-like [Sitodiplosis mosellana]XP_055321089.1 autophagy protein 12-like [Sitodiplosis mosellana]